MILVCWFTGLRANTPDISEDVSILRQNFLQQIGCARIWAGSATSQTRAAASASAAIAGAVRSGSGKSPNFGGGTALGPALGCVEVAGMVGTDKVLFGKPEAPEASHAFARCASQKRTAMRELHLLPCENRTRFSHGRRFFNSRNVQKCVTQIIYLGPLPSTSLGLPPLPSDLSLLDVHPMLLPMDIAIFLQRLQVTSRCSNM